MPFLHYRWLESETDGSLLLPRSGGLSEEPTDPKHEARLDAELRYRLREADDPNTVWIPIEVVEAEFQALNLELTAAIEADVLPGHSVRVMIDQALSFAAIANWNTQAAKP